MISSPQVACMSLGNLALTVVKVHGLNHHRIKREKGSEIATMQITEL